jgi:phosphoglycolate phosphatase
MDILFDLDGTLVDSRPGIVASMRTALQALGLPVPNDDVLTRLIGPPTHEAFRELLGTGDRDEVLRAVAIYRKSYSTTGLFDARAYPGVPEALHALTAAGARLWVATSKPLVYAERVVEHLELRGFFAGVYGSELDGERSDKGELIAYALAREGIPRGGTWMIGDRRHDVVGAHKNGLRAAAALWGYGTRAEVEAAGADAAFDSMGDFATGMGARGAPVTSPTAAKPLGP